MSTIFDLFEVPSVTANTTYSKQNGNLRRVVDGLSGNSLIDGEFDIGDMVQIGGVSYRIDFVREPLSNGTFLLGNGTTRTFSPGSESNLSVVFLTISRPGEIRHFIIPNDSYGNINVQAITTGAIGNAAGSDAAIISTVNNVTNIVCFTSGTLIEGEGGAQLPVERLVKGDLVMTADHGLKPIEWIGKCRITARELALNPKLRPIRIEAGALGKNAPQEAMSLSPQHRVLVRSRIAERMFTEPEVLVAAKHLVGTIGVSQDDAVEEVVYYHILLDQHEILFANGLACESLFVGDGTLRALSPDAKAEILAIFPQISHPSLRMRPSRLFINGRQGRRLSARHCQNGQALLAAADKAVISRRFHPVGKVSVPPSFCLAQTS